MSARMFVMCLGLRKTEFGKQKVVVLWPMLANDVVLSVTNNLLFIPSRSATLKQKSVITYVFVAKLSSLCSADTASEGWELCVAQPPHFLSQPWEETTAGSKGGESPAR